MMAVNHEQRRLDVRPDKVKTAFTAFHTSVKESSVMENNRELLLKGGMMKQKLFHRLKTLIPTRSKPQDVLVMVRLKPRFTLLSYSRSVSMFLGFLTLLLMDICLLLILALSGGFFSIAQAFWRSGYLLIAILWIGPTVINGHLWDAILMVFGIVLLGGHIWLLAQVKQEYVACVNLWRLHRLDSSQRAQFPFRQVVKISLPSWMFSQVSYEPDPQELLQVLREREARSEQKIEAIANVLEGCQPEEVVSDEDAPLRLVLSVTHHLTLSLLAPGGKQAQVVFSDAVVPLLGFLASQEKGKWIKKEEIDRQVYGVIKERGQTRESPFGVHRARISAQISEQARLAGLLPSHDSNAALPPEGVSLFENEVRGKVSCWRLTPACTIETFPILTGLYQTIAQAMQTREEAELRQQVPHLIEEYGEGYLASHMKKGYVWFWAQPLYEAYREKCYTIFTYAIGREADTLESCKKANERIVALRHIARLHGWRALVANGLLLKTKEVLGEQDLCRCLKYYGQLKNRSAAHKFYERYCEQMTRLHPPWEPGKELKSLATQVCSLPQTGRRL